MNSYPANFPLEEVRSVLSIVKSQQIAANKERFAHDLWVIQGFAMSKILGEPNFSLSSQSAQSESLKDSIQLPSVPNDISPLTADEFVSALGELEKSLDQAEGRVAAQGLVDWKSILSLVLKLLLDKALESL